MSDDFKLGPTIESLDRGPDGTTVVVRVPEIHTLGLSPLNGFGAEWIARARAITAAGVIDTSKRTFLEVTAGEVQRFTRVKSVRDEEFFGLGKRVARDKIVTVIVNTS